MEYAESIERAEMLIGKAIELAKAADRASDLYMKLLFRHGSDVLYARSADIKRAALAIKLGSLGEGMN